MKLQVEYFVLSPMKDDDHGHASRAAISEYAFQVAAKDPCLAEDLRLWVDSIEKSLDRIRKGRQDEN